jgi:hypothetical protein
MSYPFSSTEANIEATELLRVGSYKSAIGVLKTAMLSLHAGIGGEVMEDIECDVTESLGVTFTSTGELDIEQYNSGVFPLCTDAIIFSGTVDQIHMSPNNETRAGSILLYNVALAYHKLGLCRGDCSCFDRARKYYTMCTNLLNEISIFNSTDYLIYLSAANNLGCIHSYFAETAEAREVHSNMRQVLFMYMVEAKPGSVSSCSNFEEMINKFILSVQLFEDLGFGNAAAAA